MSRGWQVVVCCIVLLGTIGLRNVSAHAFPEQAEPRVGSTVETPPEQVRIWFNSVLEAAFSHIRVDTASGERIDKGNSHVDPQQSTLLSVDVPPLAPGTYHVTWSVLARDGHHTEGKYTFTVQSRP